MSASIRLLFFVIALCTMIFLALGSVMMAQGNALWAWVFFVLGVSFATFGFVGKRKWVRKEV